MQYYEGDGKIRYYESPAWGEWCNRVYGIDLKQIGAVTKNELQLFLNNVNLLPNSRILDIGCGPGYISDYVATHYNSTAECIDIDEFAIAHAKKVFKNNSSLHFQIADGNGLSFEDNSFDLICFFDTLYFTGTKEKLRSLLNKCMSMLKDGGKLIIFWSRNFMDEEREPSADNTQVGLWGRDHNIPYNIFDLSQSNKDFWKKAMRETIAMESELQNEIPETYKQVLSECIHANEKAENIYRWLYIFTKQ